MIILAKIAAINTLGFLVLILFLHVFTEDGTVSFPIGIFVVLWFIATTLLCFLTAFLFIIGL